jgi:hypothetical protein
MTSLPSPRALQCVSLDSRFGTPSGTSGDRVMDRQRLTPSGSMTCVAAGPLINLGYGSSDMIRSVDTYGEEGE